MCDDVMGCVWVCKMHPGCFSGRKTRKDTTWSVPVVQKCFLDVQCPVLHHCNPVYSSFLVRSNVQKKLEFFTQHCHHDVLCCCKRMTSG